MSTTTKLQSFLSSDKPTTTERMMEQDECSFYSTHSQEQPFYQQHPSQQQTCPQVDTLDEEGEDPEQSITAAEPIEDDADYILQDSTIPTIRLSSLGTALLDDALQVQDEFGKVGGNSLSSEDDDDGQEEDSYDSQSGDDDDAEEGFMNHKKERLDTDRTSTTASEEMTMNMMDGSNSNSPLSQSLPQQLQQQEPFVSRRQRTVSEDGIIAEFDPDEGPYNSVRHGGINNNANGPDNPANDDNHDSNNNDDLNQSNGDNDHNGVKIVAEAIEIDASFRSDVHDLELGDEEPFPYPGGASRLLGSRARALEEESNSRQGALRFLTSHAGQYGRPELISATVIKSSVTEAVGLNLVRDETIVYSISEEEGSLLKHSPFRPGDRVLSINGRRTENMDSAEAAVLLREATGFVHIVVHNAGGDPTLVETMISKANKNQRSGMGLKSTGDRDLRVSSINENGLFAQSLLNVGDRILSINNVDVTEVDARVACDIIKNSPDHVTVVARTRHTAGVVVAEVSARGLHACSEPVLTSIAENSSSRNRNEIEAVDDTCSMNKRQREQLVIGTCVAIVLGIIMISVFGI